MRTANCLISTVGTSLFDGNLRNLAVDDPDDARRGLAQDFAARDWEAVAERLAAVPSTERLCGAEINSLASLFAQGLAASGANLFFCHSATTKGRDTGKVLKHYYQQAGHPLVETLEIADLQDDDPRRFRTHGLRNLAKQVCKIVRDYGPAQCAINATGGYKAQIAIAVLMGQALGVPVYYKHELFNEIIPFPPMPVALDFQVWMRLSGVLSALAREGEVPAEALNDAGQDAEVLESLVERVEIDGRDYLDLSPTGQIFHETFRERFRSHRDQVLPAAVPVSAKQPPKLGDHAVINQHRDAIRRYLDAVTQDVPQVRRCETCYCNPDLPQPLLFRRRGDEIHGVYSNGSYTVGFRVETLAATDGQRDAVVAALNNWLDHQE